MKIDVLDHGFVRFIEAWGTGEAGKPRQYFDGDVDLYKIIEYECGIVEAARQSTQGAFRGWEGDGTKENPGDRKLLSHLYKNNHATPFEFAGMVIEVRAPIMVFREWHRHRTQSYNEMSARYAPLPDLYYHCHVDDVTARAHQAAVSKNRQATGVAVVDQNRVMNWVARDLDLAKILEEHYQEGLAAGVPKELARKKMPVDHYSQMRASANLRNWLAFMTLRLDAGAMWEIRQYARAVAKIVKATFPETFALFNDVSGV